MAKQLTIDGPTITRDDGSTVYCVAYKDASGKLIGKAYVPEGHSPRVPDDVDSYEVIEGDTKLSDHFDASEIGDIPDPASTAMEKLDKLIVPDDSPM